MTAYYNEFDPFAAAWLRELISAGHIAPGDVDTRSIEDVRPSDLAGYTQCHFFAGIGVWSHALRRAGWPDSRPVWTGSCPCQPFSAAGKAGGFADERHLWPHFHHLIAQCQPDIVFGEQVASKDGLGWIDLVQADLEGTGYASGAIDTCAAGVGAPHIRQRLYWFGERLADASGSRLEGQDARTLGDECSAAERSVGTSGLANTGRQRLSEQRGRRLEPSGSSALGTLGGLADLDGNGCDQRRIGIATAGHDGAFGNGATGGLADAAGFGRGEQRADTLRSGKRSETKGLEQRLGGSGVLAGIGRPRPTNGIWSDADWLFCRDGKWRPVEPGTFPLAHGAPARVGRLRGYGNAINAEAAVAFIEAYLDIDTIEIAAPQRVRLMEGVFA